MRTMTNCNLKQIFSDKETKNHMPGFVERLPLVWDWFVRHKFQ